MGRRAEQQPMGACAAQWELLEQGRKGLHREMTGCRDKLAPFRSHFLLTLSPFLPKIKTCIVLKALRWQWISKVRNEHTTAPCQNIFPFHLQLQNGSATQGPSIISTGIILSLVLGFPLPLLFPIHSKRKRNK